MARTKQTARKAGRGAFRQVSCSAPAFNEETLGTFNGLLGKALMRNINDEFSWSQYENVPELAKLWIIQDQRRLQALKSGDHDHDRADDEISHDLLQLLPLDVKYEIIDFIPTYSPIEYYRNEMDIFNERLKYAGLSYDQVKDKITNSLNPAQVSLRRKFELTHKIDKKFQTYHKMRLINREYASRMKMRILKSVDLDISNLQMEFGHVREDQLCYFLDFLKTQTMFEQGLVDLNDPVLYHHLDTIKSMVYPSDRPQKILKGLKSRPAKKAASTLEIEPEEETEPEKISLDEMINMSDEQVENLVSKLAGTSTSTAKKAKRKKALEYDEKEEEDDAKEEVYASLYALELPFPKLPQKHTRAYFESDIQEFIQVNTKLESIALGESGDLLLQVLSSICKGLKRLKITNAECYLSCDPSIFNSFTGLEEFVVFDTSADCLCGDYDLLEYIPKKCKVVCHYLEDAQDLHIQAPHAIYLDGVLQSESGGHNDKVQVHIHNSIKSIKNYMEEFLEYSYHANRRSFIDYPLKRFSIMQRKQICDYMRDNNISIEELSLQYLDDDITAYLVYIANTYQGGRISTTSYVTLENCFNFGWVPTNLDEIILSLDWRNVQLCIEKFKNDRKNDRNDFILLLRAILLGNLVSNSSCAYTLFKFIKSQVNEEEIRRILAPVDGVITKQAEKIGRSLISVPIIALPFDNYQFALELIDIMTPEELEQQNELGDTCLHSKVFHCNEVIEKMIEKQPKLTQILNPEQRNILHFRTMENVERYPLILKLLTKYGMDYLQQDKFGRKPLSSVDGQRNIYEFYPESGILLKF